MLASVANVAVVVRLDLREIAALADIRASWDQRERRASPAGGEREARRDPKAPSVGRERPERAVPSASLAAGGSKVLVEHRASKGQRAIPVCRALLASREPMDTMGPMASKACLAMPVLWEPLALRVLPAV